MQIPLLPGSTGPVMLNDDQSTVYVPITQMFRSMKVTVVGGQVELVPGYSGNNVQVRACVREFSTDDSQRAPGRPSGLR